SLGDGDVVHVTFAHAGGGDAHEHRLGAQVGDVVTAGVAHRGAQAAGELVQDGDHTALVWHASLDPLGHELLQLGRRILKVSVGGAVTLTHGPERTHTAVGLVGGALVKLDFARGFLG